MDFPKNREERLFLSYDESKKKLLQILLQLIFISICNSLSSVFIHSSLICPNLDYRSSHSIVLVSMSLTLLINSANAHVCTVSITECIKNRG